jgi:sugar lactone lactonase YvrE
VSENSLLPTRVSITVGGIPDGLTIDSSGNLWVALWGEGRVECWSQTGVLQGDIAVAAPHTTSVAFAGEHLDTLVITTARYGMDVSDLERFPSAGDLFTTTAPLRGRAAELDFF